MRKLLDEEIAKRMRDSLELFSPILKNDKNNISPISATSAEDKKNVILKNLKNKPEGLN